MWIIAIILLVVVVVASIILDEIARRDFNRRRFSSFEEKQAFKKILFWTPWGSYKYLRIINKKPPVFDRYIKILSAIALLVLAWLISDNSLIGPKIILSVLALTSLFKETAALIKIRLLSVKQDDTKK
jgi:hypothetical protein